MARQEIVNGISYNEGFNRANNNFVEVYQQINNFASKGYDLVKDVGVVDFNTLKTQGKYLTNYGNNVNPPVAGLNMFFIDITGSSTYFTQEVISLNGVKFLRTYNNGVWTAWTQIVTTNKLEIDIPLANGFVTDIASASWKNKIIRNNDGSYDLWFSVKKSDGSNIPIGYLQIGYMVGGHKPNAFYIGSGISVESDLAFTIGFCYADSERLMFHNTYANAKSLRGYIRFRTD